MKYELIVTQSVTQIGQRFTQSVHAICSVHSRYIMRIFRVGSKSRKVRKQNSFTSKQQQQQQVVTIPSIGSDLAASDQFEILVAKKETNVTGELRKKSKGSFLSYFGSDNDDSTVSSITTLEYGGFFQSKKSYNIRSATNAAAESISSWCCCGDSDNTTAGATRRTHLSSTENTLIQNSAYGTIQPTDSRSHQYRSISGSRCCGPDYSISPNQRQKSFSLSNFFGGRSRTSAHNINDGYNMNRNRSLKNSPNTSASLFDDLSEDELDLQVNRSTSFSVRRGKKNATSQSDNKPVSLRRVMTWKRKLVV
jgi:hypothetical protein